MISKKTIYGLEAMILLAKRYDSEPVLIKELALEGDIPKKFLEIILLELKKNKVLKSKKGKGGGYVLAKAPQDISLENIIRTLEGPLPDLAFDRETKENNEIKLILRRVQKSMSDILEKTSLSDVINQACNGQDRLNYVI